MPLISCADCGNAVSTRASACPRCGAPNSAASSSPFPDRQNEPASRHLRSAVVALAVFGVALAGSLLYFSGAQQSSAQPAPPVADSAAATSGKGDSLVIETPVTPAVEDSGVTTFAFPESEYGPAQDPYPGYPVTTTDSTITTTTTTDTAGVSWAYPVPSHRPSDPSLIEWLNGQRFRVARRLLDEIWWTIEPGEITEFGVLEDWRDPAGVSWGVRIQFIARAADGEAVRVQGLLRYYGDGSEGNGHMFRDFIPEHVERLR